MTNREIERVRRYIDWKVYTMHLTKAERKGKGPGELQKLRMAKFKEQHPEFFASAVCASCGGPLDKADDPLSANCGTGTCVRCMLKSNPNPEALPPPSGEEVC